MPASIVSEHTNDLTILLRLLGPFTLGALVTLVVTAVNHKRDHIKHVRETVSSSVQSISQEGAAFWANEFSHENLVQLRGAVTYLQHILPYALESTSISKETADTISDKFGEVQNIALFAKGELDEEGHEVDLHRVTKLMVCCAQIEATFNNTFLKKMSFSSLMVDAFRTFLEHFACALRKLHNIFLVP